MPDWSVGRRLGPIERGPAPSGSAGAAITTGATAHVKSGWVTLIAATTRPTYELFIGLQIQGGVAECLMDIGIGAAGSEQVEISNLYVSKGTVVHGMMVHAPIKIPQGARVAARMQSSAATAHTVSVTAYCAGSAAETMTPFDDADGIGVSTATSRATTFDGGGTANTKVAYVQLIAATTRDYRGFYVIPGNGIAARASGAAFAVDVAMGAAGVEQILLPDLVFQSDASENITPVYGPFWIPIPSGARLAVRGSCSSIVSTDRTLDIALLGVY